MSGTLGLRDDATSFFTLGGGWGERGLKSYVIEKYFLTYELCHGGDLT